MGTEIEVERVKRVRDFSVLGDLDDMLSQLLMDIHSGISRVELIERVSGLRRRVRIEAAETPAPLSHTGSDRG